MKEKNAAKKKRKSNSDPLQNPWFRGKFFDRLLSFRCQFHQHICVAFSSEQDEKLFLANGKWRTELRFGNRCTYAYVTNFSILAHKSGMTMWQILFKFSAKILVKLNSKFFDKRFFAWRTNVGEIDPRRQKNSAGKKR